MPFQFNSKNVFLTYPQCPVSINDLLQFFRTFPNLVYCTVSRELHKDGTPHAHALLSFSKPFRTRSENAFNFQNYHPNMQSAKSKLATRRYVQKDGDFLEHGEWVETTSQKSVSDNDVREKLKLPLLDFLIWASTNRVQYADKLWSLANTPEVNSIKDDDQIEGSIDLRFQKLVMRSNWNILKPVVVVGASGIGKTTWAKRCVQVNNLCPCLFVSHADTLKEFKAGYHKSIIFDDVSFTHMPITTQIAICDMENPRQVHCRHRKADIPAGVFKIFTCNDPPLDLEHPAIARRVEVIHCGPSELKLVTDVVESTIQSKENQ